MRNLMMLVGLAFVGVLTTGNAVSPNNRSVSSSNHQEAQNKPGPKLETLLRAHLEVTDSTEVIVSRVSLPPNTALPKHWHPGEEFAYVLEGSVVLWQKGKDEVVAQAGDVVKIPLKQVHTAITREQGATALVFRVHRQGQPERIPVE